MQQGEDGLRLDRLALHQGSFRLTADWALPAGARLALIGPSGAGKSTLLSAIAGFVAPHQGRIFWKGQDLASLAPGERPLSILFQDQNLFPHLTLTQNLGLGLRPDLRLSAGQTAEVARTLDEVGLAGLGTRRPAQLSGGQMARAALARALLRARPMLLLDEPFAALGPALKADMLTLVGDVVARTKATLIMVTHDPDDAHRLSTHVGLVADGVSSAPQPTEQAFAHPPKALSDYLGS